MTTGRQLVLVTGGGGFIAGHRILQLVERGFEVRATVRSLEREDAVRAVLADAGLVDDARLTFVAADLGLDARVYELSSPRHRQEIFSSAARSPDGLSREGPRAARSCRPITRSSSS